MITELMIIHVCTDRVTISNVGLREKTETKRQQRLKKTSDSLYIKLAGRKTAIISITGELEYVKALFNFFNIYDLAIRFLLVIYQKIIIMYK